jgi:hypothetical protein
MLSDYPDEGLNVDGLAKDSRGILGNAVEQFQSEPEDVQRIA